MPISNDLFLAILAMDSYNRGYGSGLNVGGNQIGNATLSANSSILLDANIQPLDQPAGFFAQSYKLANGSTVISYRGTDKAARSRRR